MFALSIERKSAGVRHIGRTGRLRVLVSIAGALAALAFTVAHIDAQEPEPADTSAPDDSATVRPTGGAMLTVVRRPRWWLEQSSGYDLSQHTLVVGSVWRNNADVPVDFTVDYTVYAPNGAQLGQCQASVTSLPRDSSAWAFCEAADLNGYVFRVQLATRIDQVSADQRIRIPASVGRSLVQVRSTGISASVPVTAWTHIQPSSGTDVYGEALYRFWDRRGRLLGSCESYTQVFQREVSRLVSTRDPCLSLPRRLSHVAKVTAELLVRP